LRQKLLYPNAGFVAGFFGAEGSFEIDSAPIADRAVEFADFFAKFEALGR
jgi:hypothetical protein